MGGDGKEVGNHWKNVAPVKHITRLLQWACRGMHSRMWVSKSSLASEIARTSLSRIPTKQVSRLFTLRPVHIITNRDRQSSSLKIHRDTAPSFRQSKFPQTCISIQANEYPSHFTLKLVNMAADTAKKVHNAGQLRIHWRKDFLQAGVNE